MSAAPAMSDVLLSIGQSYAEGLHEYLREGDEPALWRAYQLGREVLEQGGGPLEVVELHQSALSQLAEGFLTPEVNVRTLEAASDFLAEALAPVEMAYGAFRTATDALRRQAEALRQGQASQAQELRKSLERSHRLEEQRRRLVGGLVEAEEKERWRIAADIHDDSLQVLAAVIMRLDALARTEQDPDRLEAIQDTRKTVALASGRLRHLLFELRPPALGRLGLASALRNYLEQVQAETGIDFRLEDQIAGEPPVDTSIVLYRIIQEALANVRKHAQAQQVHLALAQRDRGYLVLIEDDGRGFDPKEPVSGRTTHIGLSVMRERAETAGGWCRVESVCGAGTRVEFWLPGDQPE